MYQYRFEMFAPLAILLVSIYSSTVVLAEDTPVTLKNISTVQLEKYKKPQLLDGPVIEERVRQLRAGVEALIHMSEMISEPHARRAMKAQIDSIKATLESLEIQVKSGAVIDYDFPTPLPIAGESSQSSKSRKPRAKLQKSSTSNSIPTPRKDQIKPMSAAQLSQLWGALEQASFRNEKMAVIRGISRDHYLTTQQAELFVESLTFSKDRRDAVKLLYPRLVDPGKIEIIYRLLDQPAHRREVQKEIEQINMNRRMHQAQGQRRTF